MIARDKKDETRGDIDATSTHGCPRRFPKNLISWRIDGKPVAKNGKFVARFVAYIEANTVRERLDASCRASGIRRSSSADVHEAPIARAKRSAACSRSSAGCRSSA
jgi:hypothetical protein